MNPDDLELKRPVGSDEVIAEVRRVKEKLARRFNFDIRAMVDDARKRQGGSGHRVVDRSTMHDAEAHDVAAQ